MSIQCANVLGDSHKARKPEKHSFKKKIFKERGLDALNSRFWRVNYLFYNKVVYETDKPLQGDKEPRIWKKCGRKMILFPASISRNVLCDKIGKMEFSRKDLKISSKRTQGFNFFEEIG